MVFVLIMIATVIRALVFTVEYFWAFVALKLGSAAAVGASWVDHFQRQVTFFCDYFGTVSAYAPQPRSHQAVHPFRYLYAAALP